MNKKQMKERTKAQQAEKPVTKAPSMFNRPEVVVKSTLSNKTINLIRYATKYGGDTEYTVHSMADDMLNVPFNYQITYINYNGDDSLTVQGVAYPLINPNREAYRLTYFTNASTARKAVNIIMSRLDGELRNNIYVWTNTGKRGIFPQFRKVINDHIIDELFVCKLTINDFGYRTLNFYVKPKEVELYKQSYNNGIK